jgi:hypothetical protein
MCDWNVCVCIYDRHRHTRACNTRTGEIVEGQKTAFHEFEYEFTTAKPLENKKRTVNYFLKRGYDDLFYSDLFFLF